MYIRSQFVSRIWQEVFAGHEHQKTLLSLAIVRYQSLQKPILQAWLSWAPACRSEDGFSEAAGSSSATKSSGSAHGGHRLDPYRWDMEDSRVVQQMPQCIGEGWRGTFMVFESEVSQVQSNEGGRLGTGRQEKAAQRKKQREQQASHHAYYPDSHESGSGPGRKTGCSFELGTFSSGTTWCRGCWHLGQLGADSAGHLGQLTDGSRKRFFS